jgi:hypothetical protein
MTFTLNSHSTHQLFSAPERAATLLQTFFSAQQERIPTKKYAYYLKRNAIYAHHIKLQFLPRTSSLPLAASP